MAPLHYAAKFDPFLSLDCAGMEGRGRNPQLATLRETPRLGACAWESGMAWYGGVIGIGSNNNNNNDVVVVVVRSQRAQLVGCRVRVNIERGTAKGNTEPLPPILWVSCGKSVEQIIVWSQ